MIKGILRTGTSKNFIIITGRYKNFVNSKVQSIKSPKLTDSPFLQISCIQKRFCSSNSSASAIHKVFFVNAESPSTDDATNITSDSIEYIPPPPPMPPEVITEETIELLNRFGESTFHSLGLGGWSPIGLLQNCIEFFHVSVGLPWWGSIAVVTVIMRTLLFPLVIKAQRNNAVMNNYLPTIQLLQKKITEARSSGNNYEAAKASHELQQFMTTKGLNPLKNMVVPLVQAPIFVSMFIGLRRCANLPVESFKIGGMLWFVDLTISDPFYLLPIITSATLFVTIEIGADGQQMSTTGASRVGRYVLRALPIIIFPFICNFPAALLCYWVSTNFMSLLQVAFLRIPAVRTYFKINPLVKHDKSNLPIKSKGVIKDMKESWSNMKLTSQLNDRQKNDEMRFRRAGTGPLVKTFKHNPLQMKAKER